MPLLNNLVDVRVFNFENPLGFRIAFTFKPNEYFIDTELTKDYFLKCEPAEDENPLLFEGNRLNVQFFLLTIVIQDLKWLDVKDVKYIGRSTKILH